MILDLQLMRQIALLIESQPPQQMLDVKMPDRDHALVMEHVHLLVMDGYMEGIPLQNEQGCIVEYTVIRLTMKGHDFARNAKNDTIWKKVAAEAKERGDSISMTIFNRLLGKAAEKYAGLE